MAGAMKTITSPEPSTAEETARRSEPRTDPRPGPPADLAIDFDRLQRDLEELLRIGLDERDHGIYRMAFSDAFMEAHQWLRDKIAAAGLTAEVDGAYNVICRLGEPGKPAVATGSHLDSVPGGGNLDGGLGVLAGLECLRRFDELGVPLRRPVELCVFTDEEGRFGGMLGSQAMSGQLTPGDVLGAKDLAGVTLVEAMEARGLDPMHALRAARKPDALAAFVELHIEQGPVLHRGGLDLGVVEGISGLHKWNARLLGDANHAGTTPMSLRRDAFQGLAEIAGEIDRILEENGSDRSVATIGRVELVPGAANVVPSRVEFTLEFRDLDPDVLAEIGLGFRRAMSAVARRRGLRFEYEVLSELEPIGCDRRIVSAIENAAGSLGARTLHMPSGAAHDTGMIADIAPVGMIFVPSKDGVSHSAAEWTSWESIETGANCLLRTLYALAS